MIHMAHDGDDGSAWHEVGLIVLYLRHCLADLCTDIFRGEAELLGHDVDGLGIQTLVDAHHDADLHAGADDLGDGNVHHRCQLVGGNELRQFQYLALCCLVLELLLHALTYGIALLAAVLGTLAHLGTLAGQAGQCLAYLLGYLLIAHLGLAQLLAWLVLLLVLLAATLLVVIVVLLVVLLLYLLAHGIHIDAFLADAYTLLALTVATLATVLRTVLVLTLPALLLLGLLLGARALVEG